jgi:hypothetical protein
MTRCVDGDEVGALQQLVEGDQRDAHFLGRLGGEEGVVGDDAHLEALGAVGHDGAHPADADDPEGLVVDLGAHELVLLPLARLHRGRGLGDLPGECKHHGDGVLGRGDGVPARGVHDDDAALACGVDVDVVDPDAGPPDDLEVVGPIDDLLRDLRGAADGKAVVVLDNPLELVGREAGHHVHLEAGGVLQYLDPLRGQRVADKHSLHVFFPFPLSCHRFSLTGRCGRLRRIISLFADRLSPGHRGPASHQRARSWARTRGGSPQGHPGRRSRREPPLPCSAGPPRP